MDLEALDGCWLSVGLFLVLLRLENGFPTSKSINYRFYDDMSNSRVLRNRVMSTGTEPSTGTALGWYRNVVINPNFQRMGFAGLSPWYKNCGVPILQFEYWYSMLQNALTDHVLDMTNEIPMVLITFACHCAHSHKLVRVAPYKPTFRSYPLRHHTRLCRIRHRSGLPWTGPLGTAQAGTISCVSTR
uniref:Uncharacterized protein n=1 Tax=Ananas comosus var. bracteatus TaxID=296719 RepID=A0A6V7P5B1_ANACO|nr:unnamed protein product [Ananas comosus var. bracteatus]